MWTSRWGVFSGHVDPLQRVSTEKHLRPPFLARKRPDFGPISLLRWPVCVSNGAVVHVDGQQSKKMHGQQNSEALNQVQQSRVSSENPTSLNFFLGQYGARLLTKPPKLFPRPPKKRTIPKKGGFQLPVVAANNFARKPLGWRFQIR